MQNLIEQMTEEIINGSHILQGESIAVKLKASDDGWIAESAVNSVLKSLGYQVFFQNDTMSQRKFLFDVMTAHYHVQYDEMFRDGLLGVKKVKRTISTELSAQTFNTRTNEVLFSGSLSKQAADTVAVDDIQTIELPSVKSTHGELPAESFLDRIVEPFVIIGVTAVAIYLFFHVRS